MQGRERDPEVAAAVGRVLRADRDAGRLRPLAWYERLFPGFEQVVRAEWESVRSAARPAARRIGAYEILDEIARGAGGVVYRARQPDLDRIVAVKIVHGGDLAGPEELQRFRAEAQAAAALRHPNIVAIHEIGEHEGLPYFSMEHVEGPTLDAFAGGRPVGPRRAARIARRIADAIGYAHAHGVVHRDLKPTNVLISDGDEPRITDFGLAKRLGADLGLTHSGSIVGTPGYMPPEQAQGRAGRCGPWSDVYSIGAILYEMLTGRPPFTGASVFETLQRVLEDDPIPVRALSPLVPDDLATITAKCLAKEPEQRYATATELGADLDRFLGGEPVLARPVGRLERGRAWCRRNPVVATLAGAVFAVLVAATVALTRLSVDLQGERDAAVAQRNRARREEREKTGQLWLAYRSQARTARVSGLPGRRFECLEAVRAATAIRRDDVLRDEAAAAIALADLRARVIALKPADRSVIAFDAQLERWVEAAPDGSVHVARADDDSRRMLCGPGPRAWLGAFSPDGRHLWTKHHPEGRNDDTVLRVWDLAAGTLRFEEDRSVCAAFSPDGTRVAVARPDGTVAESALDGTAAPRTLRGPWTAQRIAYAPDGRRIAASSAERSEVVVLGGDADVRLPHPAPVRGIAWSPDGAEIATACGDRVVRVWRLSPVPVPRLELPAGGIPVEVALDESGCHVWSQGWDGKIRLWDAADGHSLVVADGAGGGPWVRSDGQQVALFSDRAEHVGVWDVAYSDASALLADPAARDAGSVHDVRFSPDGRLVVTAADDGVRIWDVASQSHLALLPHELAWGLAFAGDSLLVVAGGRLVEHSVAADARTVRVGGPRTLVARGVTNARSVAPLGNSSRVAVARNAPDGACEVVVIDRDRPGDAPVPLGSIRGAAAFLAASPDGTLVAAAPFMGGECVVWDVAARGRVAAFPADLHAAPEFAPDGRRLVIGSVRAYRSYDTATWTEAARLDRRKTTVWGPAAFLGDSGLAAVVTEPGAPRLVEAATLTSRVALEGPERETSMCLASNDDGTVLVVPVDSAHLRLWHVGALRRELRDLGLDWPGPGPVGGSLLRARAAPAYVQHGDLASSAGDGRAVLPDFAAEIVTTKMRPVAGRRRVLAVLWDPHRPGHAAPARADVERLLFGPRPSVADWFAENSGGRLRLEPAGVLGWYDAAKPSTHYWSSDERDGDGDGWVHGHAEKWFEALTAADAEFDFARFDEDRDGVVSPDELAVLVVIPQRQPFGTVRPPVCREKPVPAPLVLDGVRVPMLAEWYAGDPPNLGAPAHELAHLLLGAPDLYRTGDPAAPGPYSIMDRTYVSAHLGPFEKLKLGWTRWEVASPGEAELPDVETTGRVAVLWDPAHGPGEYFLLENRWRGASYDAGAGTAGGGLPADGLAVWHVVEDPAVFDRFGTAGAPGEWGRRGLRLVRADDAADDAGALFSAAGARAALRWADGTPAPFEVTVVSAPGPRLRYRVRRR